MIPTATIEMLGDELLAAKAELKHARMDNARLVADNKKLGSDLTEARVQLKAMWEADDRPWFCRACDAGRLVPFGQYGFCCAKCEATYVIASPKKPHGSG